MALSSASSAGLRPHLPQQPLQPTAERALRGPSALNSPAAKPRNSWEWALRAERSGLPSFTRLPSLPFPPHFSQCHKNPFLFSGCPDLMGPQHWARRMSAQAAWGGGELVGWENAALLPFMTGIKDFPAKISAYFNGAWLGVA